MTKYVEPNVGQIRGPGEPQSGKSCEECLYFDRDLASDKPCGLCYESKDKFNWEKKEDGDAGPSEVEQADAPSCGTCIRER